MKRLESFDPEVAKAIQEEIRRLESGLELIPSENLVSPNVLEALGSVMTIKYAEGYPGKRYYGGCEFVDQVENLAIERAKQLFGADHANVQPHSGSQANMAVYFSMLKPGDTILGMNLAQGGHLTHGSPVNFSGQFYQVIPYGVNPETELLDYDQAEDLAKKHKPKMIVTGASAYSRDIDFKKFREIADKVGAYLLADIAHPAGLVAAKLHSDPPPLFLSGTTAAYAHPYSFFSDFMSESDANWGRFSSAEFDRAALKNDIERADNELLGKQCAVIPLYFRKTSSLISEKWKGFEMNPMTYVYLKNVGPI